MISSFKDKDTQELFEVGKRNGQWSIRINDQYRICFAADGNSFYEVEIVDYGCGQGLATLCYHDYLQEHNKEQKVKRIILIEPSSMALSRAELLCSRFYPDVEIIAINKQFDELTKEDLIISSEMYS